MSLDTLELHLRKLSGVISVAFVDVDGVTVVEIQAAADAPDDLAPRATRTAIEQVGRAVTVEIVRCGDSGPGEQETRLRLLDVGTDPAGRAVLVRLARGDDLAVGRGSTDHGLMGAVEATVDAVSAFVPALPFLAGWARRIETTPDRRYLVVASVTDPHRRCHRRGVAEGATPVEAAVRATLAALNRAIGRGT
jgi:hypothetical protein